MKISVIVPVYNTEKYLSKCLKSLVEQTFGEMEIIVVNDGSTDNSQKIIDDFSVKFPQIKSFQKPNSGLSDARNFGIEKATGDFIGFVDSDDFVDKTMFEKMYGLAEKHRAEIVFCDLIKVDENGNEIRELPQSPQLPEKIELEKNFEIFGEMPCFACNKIFKKSLFNNLQFRVGIHFEDVELIPKLMLNSTIVAKINRPFYRYFERTDSITRSHSEKGLDMFRAVENVVSEFEKSKYNFNQNELERFLILQGFYSYLAYVAYVKDKKLKKKMLEELNEFLWKHKISKFKILNYKRFNENYLLSLPLKKQLFYLSVLVHRNLILSF